MSEIRGLSSNGMHTSPAVGAKCVKSSGSSFNTGINQTRSHMHILLQLHTTIVNIFNSRNTNIFVLKTFYDMQNNYKHISNYVYTNIDMNEFYRILLHNC